MMNRIHECKSDELHGTLYHEAFLERYNVVRPISTSSGSRPAGSCLLIMMRPEDESLRCHSCVDVTLNATHRKLQTYLFYTLLCGKEFETMCLRQYL